MSARQAATINRPGFHAAGDPAGLLLQVTAGGGRSWLYRYQVAGRRRSMGLGSFEDVGLAEARELARAARKRLLDGVDPIEARRAERAGMAVANAKAISFRDCAIACHAALRPGWFQ